MIFEFLILCLLLYGAYTDIKTRTVSNKITFCIILLSLPLIWYNAKNISGIHVFLFAGLLFCFFLVIKGQRQAGGADVKALIPIILTLDLPHLYFFLIFILMGNGILHLKYGIWKSIPFFVSFTGAYLLTFIMPEIMKQIIIFYFSTT